MASSSIDLSSLPAPAVVEPLSFDSVVAAMRADFLARYPAFSAMLDSDPVMKLLDVAAYREVLMRLRVNEAARATMVAYARGADLENLGALLGVGRLSTNGVSEDDQRFRSRIAMSLEGYSTAGSRGSYLYHALSASALVKDIGVDTPIPGVVRLTVLSTHADGAPDLATLAAVRAAVNDDRVRPLTDRVDVQAAAIRRYDVRASLDIDPGPDSGTVLAAASAALQRYVAQRHGLGVTVPLSGLMAALHQPGVAAVRLTQPLADIVPASTEAAFCASVSLAMG
ncbi:baseplate assembly protein [Azospirillum cavernae]|uniref:Baseplate assembly protein n=1 Tax=Azospirillum cavernae TaxID=2320860 RepID=A0A418VVE4_9PROT|nr:baseplate J/gp47 family protein [Azospirillum cavernae]RJF81130.1 baseplate assembly protein [Azospirillum cavernae]